MDLFSKLYSHISFIFLKLDIILWQYYLKLWSPTSTNVVHFSFMLLVLWMLIEIQVKHLVSKETAKKK